MNRHLILALALSASFLTGLAIAQPGNGSMHDPEARLQRLTTVLELSPAQQSTLRTLFERRHAEMQARREARQQERKAKREAMRAEHEQHRAAMRNDLAGVLNAEQLAKLDALMAERREHGRQRQGGEHHGGEHHDVHE